jgi:hypothetical protein
MSSSRRPLIAVLTTLAFAAAMSAQAGTAFGATTARHAHSAAGQASRAAAQAPSTTALGATGGAATRAAVSAPGSTTTHQSAADTSRRTATSRASANAPRPSATRPAPGKPVTHLPAPREQAAAGPGYEPLPNLPVNACQDSSLPRDSGTNFRCPATRTASASPTRP